jgi:hypothetical protein
VSRLRPARYTERKAAYVGLGVEIHDVGVAYLVVGFDVELDLLAGERSYSVALVSLVSCVNTHLLKLIYETTYLICMLAVCLLPRPEF